MRFFLESELELVQRDAPASVSLQFANGVRAAYNGSWCSAGQETPWNANWRFECERGVVTLHHYRVYAQLRGDALVCRGGYSQFQNGESVEVEPVELAHVAQAYLLHEFYEAVTQHKAAATTCQDNIKSLGIVFDVVKSCETGRPVGRGE
jgi:predicted dehydrogenase